MDAIKAAMAEALPPMILLVILICGIISFAKAYWRADNISKHGWPPPHCDADGELNPFEEVKIEKL